MSCKKTQKDNSINSGKNLHEQSEKFNRDRNHKKRNQTEILLLQNKVNGMKNAIKSLITSRLGQAEKRICELEER